ncbi:hypothetical protein K0M31_013508 [Melipona bicolor]|uniref:Uncharacterized protein n=1 Tax=Melipona bicolor TaxID=60889 RepID=A0AA40FI61_9HYME|nr:hypothetical protein K0M31_013508 [Melipona bicolor]
MVPGAWPPAASAEPPSKFAARFARRTKRYQQRPAEAGEQPVARHNAAISGCATTPNPASFRLVAERKKTNEIISRRIDVLLRCFPCLFNV